MIMSWVWAIALLLSIGASIYNGTGGELSSAVLQGAQAGVQLAFSMAGAICLWSGVACVMTKVGLTGKLSAVLRPLLHRLFPSTRTDTALSGALSSNICANILGLGNAATPMGIQAAKRLVDPRDPHRATDELCRLIVLNTASIQLIPSNVAAVRASLGAAAPFDILPAVWVTSLCSAALGVTTAWVMGKLWKHG